MRESEYQRILRKYSGQKMRLNREGMREVRALLRDAARSIGAELDAMSSIYGQDNVRVEQLRDLNRRIENAIDEFTRSYRVSVDATRDGLGDSAMHRIRDLTAEASGVTPASDILIRAKLGAFEKLATRTRFKDGLLLSDRIWRVGDDAKRKIGSILAQDVLKGYHPTRIARDLRGYVAAPARGNLRYVTQRLARTEHTAAFATTSRETIRAINRDKEIPIKFGMRFNVSAGHTSDTCDDHLSRGDIEPDIYSTGSFPTIPIHPHCECYDTPVPLLNGKPL